MRPQDVLGPFYSGAGWGALSWDAERAQRRMAQGTGRLLTLCLPATEQALRRVCGWLEAADLLRNFGAGEGIRTLDPNLGKVVLYP